MLDAIEGVQHDIAWLCYLTLLMILSCVLTFEHSAVLQSCKHVSPRTTLSSHS